MAKFQEAIKHEPQNAEYKSAYLQARERAVSAFLEQGRKAASDGKSSEAEKQYRRVLGIDPNNDRAREGLNELEARRRHDRWLKEAQSAADKKDFESSGLKLSTILAENPHHGQARTLQRTLTNTNSHPATEPGLASAYKKLISIEFRDLALRQVFEVVARTSGLNFLFDKDVKTDQKTSIFLKNSTIESAIHFLLLTNQLELQVLDANTILIYPNTPAKVKDYQEQVIRSFYLGNADVKTVANSLKSIIKTRDLVVDEKLNMLIMRDSPEAVRLAEKLIALHDVPEPEVMLEVEILEVKRTSLLELGIKWPESLALTPLPSTSGGTLTLRDLQNLNSSKIGAGLSPFTINARKQDTDANILANPRIRARNREKAKILIGERVPNITSTATSTGFVSESINYVDVGLKLEVEPTVHLDNDVAIKISLEVSNIVSQLQTKSGSLAYQIGTRTASTVLRLKDGENQVLAGLINDEDRRSASKVPGLGEIPVIGRLFGSTGDDNQKTEIVLSITPRLVRNIQRPESIYAEFRAGTENSFRLRPESSSGAPAIPGSSPAPTQKIANPMSAPPSPALTSLPSPQPTASQAPVVPAPSGAMAMLTAPPTGQGAAVQLRWQGPNQVKVGDTFAIQLATQSDQPVTGLPVAVGFDQRVLQVTNITEGDFLRQGGAQSHFASQLDPNGQIFISGTRNGDGGAMAPGTVATIQFRAIAPASGSQVQIRSATPVGIDGKLVPAQQTNPFQLKIVQ